MIVSARRPLLLAAFAAALQAAQVASLAGPEGAYWFDAASRTIRSLRGFSGAATVGPAVLDQTGFAGIAPNGRTAFVQQQDRPLWIEDLRHPEFAIPVSISGSGIIAWSADSKCFAAYETASDSVSRVCMGRVLDRLPMGSAVEHLALNRDGSELAAAGGGRIVRFSAAAGLAAVEGPQARSIAFAGPGDPLVFAGAAGVFELRGETPRLMISADQLSLEPLEVMDAGRGRIGILGKDQLIVIDHDGAVLRRQPLDAGFGTPLRIGPQKYLSSRQSSENPLYLLDFSRDEILFFVPVTDK